MKNVILTSSGFVDDYPRSKKIDEMFLEVSKDRKVLIIKNATLNGSNASQVLPVYHNFLAVGASLCDIVEITSDNDNCVLNYDVIYMMGGSTNLLLDMIKNTDIKNYIHLFLEQGGIYIGESAGSFVATDNLEWVWNVKKGLKPKYDIIPESFEGLGITDIKVYPHLDRYSNSVREDAKKKDNSIMPLCDGEFIEDVFEKSSSYKLIRK